MMIMIRTIPQEAVVEGLGTQAARAQEPRLEILLHHVVEQRVAARKNKINKMNEIE